MECLRSPGQAVGGDGTLCLDEGGDWVPHVRIGEEIGVPGQAEKEIGVPRERGLFGFPWSE